jgi:hypothetical protein
MRALTAITIVRVSGTRTESRFFPSLGDNVLATLERMRMPNTSLNSASSRLRRFGLVQVAGLIVALKKNPSVNSNKVALMGFSLGAYIAARTAPLILAR